MRHLIISLEAPLMAFGDEIVDANGRVRPFPGASNLTGLFANALGWTRGMRQRHQALQERLLFAVRLDRPGQKVQDFQTAKLEANDRGWTTRGRPEGREGGSNTYKSPHIRYRDLIADAALLVAIALDPPDDFPTVEGLADALARPARPLFLGRKSCLPSCPLVPASPDERFIDAANPFDAVARVTSKAGDCDPHARGPIVLGPERVDLPQGLFERLVVADERNWLSGVHGGSRTYVRGRLRDLPDHVPEGAP